MGGRGVAVGGRVAVGRGVNVGVAVRVTVRVKVLTPQQWQQVVRALSGQALFVAKLLAGEMPQDIEQVFAEAKLSLFPQKQADLETACSCPDWSNPCKHVAAVYYLLGEEFDRDPFLLFTLRGITREALVGQLSDRAMAEGTADVPPPLPPEPLSVDPAAFWGGAPLPEDPFGEVRKPPVAAALPKRLGSFPFWRGDTPFLEALEPLYIQASQRGLDTF